MEPSALVKVCVMDGLSAMVSGLTDTKICDDGSPCHVRSVSHSSQPINTRYNSKVKHKDISESDKIKICFAKHDSNDWGFYCLCKQHAPQD